MGQLAFGFQEAPADEVAREDSPRPAARVLEPSVSRPSSDRRDLHGLTRDLTARFSERIHVVLNDNRRTMLSGKRRLDGRIELRLHRMFLHAPDEVLDALHRYLAFRDRRSGRRLDVFIEANRARITAPKRRTLIRSEGRHHDLAVLFARLEARYFPGQLAGVRVTWGRHSGRRRQRSIRLGTYAMSERLIRVHPVLDQAWVPSEYVQGVLHHEMLHHVMPPVREGGRTRYHTPAFRVREREFEHFVAATAWEQAHLDRLLREA